MDKNISLNYVNGLFTISIDGNEVKKEKDIDKAIESFKTIINDDGVLRSKSWSAIEKEMEEIKLDSLKINKEYKTLECGDMKYFYRTDKTFYTKDGSMIPLVGRYEIFRFVVYLLEERKIENEEDILELLFNILKAKGNYRAKDTNLVVSSPGFNYGLCEYNFEREKINKGATIESCSFEEFKNYIKEVMKF